MNVDRAQLRGLIFDKDGTLFDFATTWESWAQAFLLRLTRGDRDHAGQAAARIGFDLDAAKFAKSSVVIAGTQREIAAALAPAFLGMSEDRLLAVLDEEAARAPQAEAVPLQPFLTALRARGLKLGVATNDSEAPARAHLDAAGVTGLFDFVAGSDTGHGGKPAPGQLLAFAQAVDLPPAACAMVGDSTHDLHAGRAAGMTTIAVLTGIAERATLAPFADVVLPNIGAIPAWLDGADTAAD